MIEDNKVTDLIFDDKNFNKGIEILINNYDKLDPISGILQQGYTIIYAICDDSGLIKYIGKTINIQNRIQSHIKAIGKGNSKLYNWMNKNWGKFQFIIIDICRNSNWKQVETAYISFFKGRGLDLLNTQAGGQGIQPGAVFSKETRSKLSIKAKQRVKRLNQSEYYEDLYRKLTDSDIESIFIEKYENFKTNEYIADKYNSNQSTISNIFNGKRYKNTAKLLIEKYKGSPPDAASLRRLERCGIGFKKDSANGTQTATNG